MVVEYSKKIKEILEGENIIELDSNTINSKGIFLVFDGIKTEHTKSVYFFSIYLANVSLNRGVDSLYPQIDVIFTKFKKYLRKCNKLNMPVLSSFDMSKKLKIYRLEISFEE